MTQLTSLALFNKASTTNFASPSTIICCIPVFLVLCGAHKKAEASANNASDFTPQLPEEKLPKLGVAPVSASAKGVKREREGCASLSCAVGLLPPLSASAKGVITIEGGFVFVGEEGEAELWRMKRQASYADSHVNPYAASQMQHMPAQRMQPNAAMYNFPGRLDSLSTEEEYQYKSSKVEEQWQSDRDAPNVSNQTSSHSFNEGQGDNGTRSYYQGQMPDQKQGSDNQSKRESRSLRHEQDIKIGYEDNPSSLTFEGLEQKFLDEIMNLVKEQSDAEVVENARHREARLNQYQQAGVTHHPNTGIHDAHKTPVAAVAEAQRDYATSQYESYKERQHLLGSVSGRTPGAEARVPYPSGRVYNNAAHHY
ncbi:hypothetical protein FCV25MIE_18742 [Fagus crenata]